MEFKKYFSFFQSFVKSPSRLTGSYSSGWNQYQHAVNHTFNNTIHSLNFKKCKQKWIIKHFKTLCGTGYEATFKIIFALINKGNFKVTINFIFNS